MTALAAPDRLVFDTAGLGSAEALARYRALYSLGADVEPIGPAPRARVEAWRLDRMLLYHRELHDIGHRRDLARTRDDGFDHFTATLLLAGGLEVDLEQATVRVGPGELLLASTARPAANRLREARLVTLAIARDRLVAASGDTDALHGLLLSPDEARLFREFVELLLRNLPTMARPAVQASAGVVVTLLGVAVDGAARRRAPINAASAGDRTDRLRRLVDARLGDPGFGTDALVRLSGLSRATLYRLFGEAGGLASFIRQRRLEALRARLGDPAERRAFGELAALAGFVSASHASRAFAARYAMRPSDYRQVAVAGTGADAFLKMRLWQDEVR